MTMRERSLRCFADALPSPVDIEPMGAEFWQALGVWHDRVLARLSDQAAVTWELSRLGRHFLSALADWVGLANYMAGESPVDELATHIALRPDQQWARDLFLTMAAVHNRRYDAIESAAAMLLPAERASALKDCCFTPRSARLAAALQAYYVNPVNLTRMMLFERSERFSYSRHLLVGSMAARSPALKLLSPTVINQALAGCDEGARVRRRSLFLDALPGGDGSAIVFIRQILREASIREMDRTLFGDQVETIVLRFSHDLSVLEQHSIRRNGVHLANAIVCQLSGADVAYRDDVSGSPPMAVATLLQRLEQGDDERLHLVEIYLNQAPADGSPHLMVRGEQGRPIRDALKHLRRKGLDLFGQVGDIRHFGVTFVPDQAVYSHPYVFKLKLDVRGDGRTIYYSGAHHSMAMRRQFEAYLKEQYDVTVIPTAQ